MARRVAHFHAGNIDARQSVLFNRTMERIKARKAADPDVVVPILDSQGRLTGPPSLWLLSPGLSEGFETLARALQTELSITPRSREIAILLTGGAARSSFEIYAHRIDGVQFGLTREEVDDLCEGRIPAFADPLERDVAATTQLLLQPEPLDDGAYARAVAALGERRLFELVVLVGFYRMIALQLETFGVGPE